MMAWTVLYNDSAGNDRWDRFDYKDDLIAYLDANGLAEDDDVWIFRPEADDYAIVPSELDR